MLEQRTLRITATTISAIINTVMVILPFILHNHEKCRCNTWSYRGCWRRIKQQKLPSPFCSYCLSVGKVTRHNKYSMHRSVLTNNNMLLPQLTQFDNKFFLTSTNNLFVMRIAERCNDMCTTYMVTSWKQPSCWTTSNCIFAALSYQAHFA